MKISFGNIKNELYNNNSVGKISSSTMERVTEKSYEVSSSLSNTIDYDNKKSFEEIKQDMADVDLKNNQDYMTVMSHQMSPADYQKMVDEGEKPASIPAEDVVTILDKIKLEVAKSGEEVKGFTDTLSKEDLENLNYKASFGDSLTKEIKVAYDEAMEVTEISEGMKKYLVSNDLNLIIDNLYLAKHSAMSEAVNPESGFYSVDNTGYVAMFSKNFNEEDLTKEVENLLTNLEIEVNPENIKSSSWLVENTLRVTEKNVEKVNDIDKIQMPVSKERFIKAVNNALSEGKNPKYADLSNTENKYETAVKLTEFVKESLVLSETQLKMTCEANLKLLESDFYIDTKDLESYVEALKKLENTEDFAVTVEESKVCEAIKEVKEAPISFIAKIKDSIETVTLSEVHNEAITLKAAYDKANIAYETMATEIRKDFGDSISKAFRNVDDILTELNMSVTRENERAVKILGYNSMPINKESIEKIKEADKEVRNVIERITPREVTKLIKKGESPLNMSIKELNEVLDEAVDEREAEIEKYSKFLYKLEKNNGITEGERKQYIEVYRFFHQLEKTGYAAIGSVLNQGRELTLDNLKQAIKTAKAGKFDIKLDESFGLLVDDLDLSTETAVETKDSLETAFRNEEYREFMHAYEAPEEVVRELINTGLPVTAENLIGEGLLMKDKGGAFKKLRSLNPEKFDKNAEAVSVAVTEKEELQEAYENLIEEGKDTVYEEVFNTDTYIDVKALKAAYIQLSVAGKKAQEENYHIPVEIDGEVTEINLKVVHKDGEEPMVSIYTESEVYGVVSARLTEEKEKITGYIASNNRDTVKKLEESADKLSTEVNVIYSKNPESDVNFSKIKTKDNDESVSFERLYQISKTFLEMVKGIK